MATAAELAILIKARDESSRVFAGVEGRVRALGNTMGTVLRAGGLAAAAGIGLAAVALKGMVQEAAEAERIAAATEAVIASTGGAAGVTAKQVDDLATSLSRVIPVDDELIASAENVMLTFVRVGSDIFPTAIEAALNMSVALGTDLQGAVIQVGKAMNDPILGMTALRRV